VTDGSLPDRGSYDTAPAVRWEDAYPVGNGRHGALIHGNPGDETVIVNHHHLVWPAPSARPAARVPPDLSHRLGEAQDLLLGGASAAALALLTDGWQDCPPRPFHPAFAVRLRVARASLGGVPVGLGDVPVGLADAGPVGYRRTLDYRTGVAAATWQEPSGQWQSGCFVSRARDVVVQSLIAPPNTSLDLAVELDVGLPGAPPGLDVSASLRERAPGDMVIVACVQYPRPGPGGYVGVTRVLAVGGTCSAARDAASQDRAAPGAEGPAGGPGGVRVRGGRELLLLTRV
jgi:alpha-L-fucosidase 2